MKTAKHQTRRCAIYTRKSSEEGLDQDFNSLDAQREACEAYIKSQAGEGWKSIRSTYDDGGFSGGSMDRPALIALLADIMARRIDTVVVYKVDRLTRSLADFAKIVEIFDAHDVAFVSVTQAFNTTTSMGRLTLNMLLSFAQFEREVTGERIRDKIAASKQKGMWMGGFVPLGYQPDGRTLVINEREAETVRTVFRLYLELGNVRRVKDAADRLGLTTKQRVSVAGRASGGRPLSRGHIYKLLNNPLYRGRIPHKGKSYEGLHPAIIDEETWEAVEAKLAANTCDRRTGKGVREPSPLAGKLFDDSGIALTPSHAVKSGRRYRYYVSRNLVNGGQANDPNQQGWRLPAREVERVVADAVTSLMTDRAGLADMLRQAGVPAGDVPGILTAAGNWKGAPLHLVSRVGLSTDDIAITLDLSDLDCGTSTAIRHAVPMRLKRRGVEMRLVLEGHGSNPPRQDPALIKAVARARKWNDGLVGGRYASVAAIAQAEGVSVRYVGQLLPLAVLAPEIVEAILSGYQPIDMSAEALIKRTDLPHRWDEQKSLLGFG